MPVTAGDRGAEKRRSPFVAGEDHPAAVLGAGRREEVGPAGGEIAAAGAVGAEGFEAAANPVDQRQERAETESMATRRSRIAVAEESGASDVIAAPGRA